MTVQLVRDDLVPPSDPPPRRHLISISDLTRDDVTRLLATAGSFERSLEREMKKLPTLRGRTVVNLFFEASTRTSSSFELAAKRLSADVMSVKSSGSSTSRAMGISGRPLASWTRQRDRLSIDRLRKPRGTPRASYGRATSIATPNR